MLKALDNSFDNSILAWETEKKKAPFYCPDCKDEVILKKGIIVIHHFAHKAQGSSCGWGVGESQEHLYAKMRLYQKLKNNPSIVKVELEEKVGNGRTDVTFKPAFMEMPINVEFQKSFISIDEINDRLKNYFLHNYAMMWIPLKDSVRHNSQEFYFRRLNFGYSYNYLGDGLLEVMNRYQSCRVKLWELDKFGYKLRRETEEWASRKNSFIIPKSVIWTFKGF